jgi:membrane-associated phospholipid phosphatase
MKNLKVFYILYTIFVAAMLALLLLNSKPDLHLWMTSFHSDFFDFFFKNYTEVGAWIPFLVVALALFYRYRIGILILFGQLFTGLIEQIIKFSWNEPRPKLFFQLFYPKISLHEVPEVRMYMTHSFPSGHTTVAFSMFLILAMYTKKKSLHALYLFMAVLVGYSRIYLSEHFAIDVLVGSLIGVFFTLPCKYWTDKLKAPWLDRSLRDIFLK